MEVSGQLHAQATLPPEKEPNVHISRTNETITHLCGHVIPFLAYHRDAHPVHI